MNKHLKTFSVFKSRTGVIGSEVLQEIRESGRYLFKSLMTLGYALYLITGWLLGLAILICCFPLATWIRLKAEKDYETAFAKAKKEYIDRLTCLHNRGNNHEQ